MIANTATSYGSPARVFHWLTALLILSAIGLGLYGDSLPEGSDAEVARLVAVLSLHKTIGIAAFFTALARILWALSQPRPKPLHPERRAETLVAEAVHWALYGAMLVLPLSGWVHHAAVTGFAPILWPFGQGLPLVPQSAAVAAAAQQIHETAATVLYITLGLHVVGALKHALIDRDTTVARMARGVQGPGSTAPVQAGTHVAAALMALLVWAAVIGAGVVLPSGRGVDAAPAPVANAPASGWVVQEGSLGIALQQMGAEVRGSFTGWTAAIDYDAATRSGEVTVTIPVGGLVLGSVTEQALGPEFFDAAAHPAAVFTGQIADAGDGLVATGTLDLRGVTVPVALPFTLEINGDIATMAGSTTLDRRDFGMGESYPNEATVGFAVRVDVALTAQRAP